MTRGKKLIILAVALAAVIAIFFLVSGVSSSYTQSLTDSTTELFYMESTDDATAVSWSYEDESVAFVKNDETWEYADDADFPVNESTLNSMVSYLCSVTSSKTIESPEDISQYGLDEPDIVITIETADSSVTLEFGDATNITGEYYCSIGDGNVYLVSSTIADTFYVDTLSMVQKESIPSMSTVNTFTVENPDGTYYFEYIEDSGLDYSNEYVWYYVADDKYTTLDNELFESYLSSATGVSFSSCVTYNANDDELEEYGLVDPAVTLTVNYTRTEEVETDEVDDDGNVIYETNTYIEDFVLLLGEYEDSYCYARLKGSSMVYLVSADIKDTYLYTYTDEMLPDDIILMDWEELTSFEVTIDGETYVFEHEINEVEDEDGNVSEESLFTYDGEEIEITSALSSLAALSSSGTTDISADGSDAVLSFTFYRDHETYPEVTLEFYKYDSSTYFTVLNGETTQLVSSSSVNSISESIIELLFPEEEEELAE